jgi:putative adenylate-forming enzyme
MLARRHPANRKHSMKMRTMLKLLHNLEQLRQHKHWTRMQLHLYQAEILRRQREYVYAHSPFYQKFHKGLTNRSLHELPVLTKSMMMEHFDELVTDRQIHLEAVRAFVESNNDGKRFLNRYRVTATSGSSGHPGFFLYDEDEWLAILASFARGQEWAGVRLSLTSRRRLASVASISAWHVSSQVAHSARSGWMPALRLAASDPLPDTIRQLNEWQPDILVAYASMARILADEQSAGRLHIQPEVVFTSSEILTEETRRRVKNVWGREPFNEYGPTETANIAAECADGRRLHVYEDLVILEVVDEQNHPVPPGEYGAKLLVTTLFSRTQPLIRYELNDSVRLSSEPCVCGLPFALVEGIQGRVEDTLHLPGINGTQVAVRPLVFNRVMDILPISDWQVIQQPDDTLTVLLSDSGDAVTDKVLVEKLSHELVAEGVRVPRIQVQIVEAIPKSSSGKSPQIKAHQPSSPAAAASSEKEPTLY